VATVPGITGTGAGTGTVQVAILCVSKHKLCAGATAPSITGTGIGTGTRTVLVPVAILCIDYRNTKFVRWLRYPVLPIPVPVQERYL
jgi:hypothetical protein